MSKREAMDWDLGTRNLRMERDGPIAWCTIDRPHARNAFTPSMYFGIKKAVQRVNKDKDLRALIITGVLCGVAGAYFSIAQGNGFINNMTAGKGFIALAALIFAKWRPVPAMFATLLFGFLDALQIRLQGATLIGTSWQIPVQFIQALPYVLTVVLLAGFIGHARPPKAGGVPYVKER